MFTEPCMAPMLFNAARVRQLTESSTQHNGFTMLETGITCAGASGGGWSDGADRRGSGCSGAGE